MSGTDIDAAPEKLYDETHVFQIASSASGYSGQCAALTG